MDIVVSVLWMGVSSDTSIHRWGLVYLCDDASFEKHRFIPTNHQSLSYNCTNQTSHSCCLTIPRDRHTEHEEQVAKVTLQRSGCIISRVRVSSSEVTQWLLWSRATLGDIANDEFSPEGPVSERTRWGSGKKKKNHNNDLHFQCCCQCFYQRCLTKVKCSCCK